MWAKTFDLVGKDATEVPPEVLAKFDLRIGGVNHNTWLVRASYDGKDLMPKLKQIFRQRAREEKKNPKEKAKPRFNDNYALELLELFGALPTAISHTKEYVPFFQGYGVKPNKPEPIRLFDAENRAEEMAEAWKVTEQYASGKLSVKHFNEQNHNDHATDIIESMWGGLGKAFYINSPNRGAISNLPYDAFVELRSHVDMRGPVPLPFGPMPLGVRQLQFQSLDTHELTADAAVSGDKALLRRAMLSDPICNNIPDADACIKDLLAAEKDALPGYWYTRR